MSALTRSPAWQALTAHREKIAAKSLRELFAEDRARAERFSVEIDELFLDYSKHLIDAETMRLLCTLAFHAKVPDWTARMFAGEALNNTEMRAALHVALRSKLPTFPEGSDVMPLVRAAREQMRRFAGEAGRGSLKGARGRPITDYVNIGIGGSHLGPSLLTRALRADHRPGLRVHFVANIDPADLEAALARLDPDTTLFIIASKTFGTAETLDNARRARAWLAASIGESAQLSRHFAAVTANPAAAAALGVPPEHVFPMWDWVGGRYSVWSAVGLPVALAVGMESFEELLEGAHAMDQHFRTAPLERNAPAILALLDIWYLNFFGARSHAILPYSEDLRELPAYLQQLEMESNGKRVDREGNEVDYATAPVIWGGAGTPSQHSFHQMLHQGTQLVPADFIVLAPRVDVSGAGAALAANALAQSAALAFGNPAPGAPHKTLPGNRPSSTLLLKGLRPRALGELIALYEHKVFTEGIIWNLNSFDQWGVEHGKDLTRALLPRLARGEDGAGFDASTEALLRRLRGHN